MLDRRTNARLRPLTLCAVSALITHESISRSMSRLMRRRTSSSLEPPEDAILVDGVSELGEVHVRDRQVVLHPLHGGRNRARNSRPGSLHKSTTKMGCSSSRTVTSSTIKRKNGR